MSIHQHATLEDTVYLWFAANDTSGSGDAGATPLFDVRLAGAAAGAIPVLSGSATRLTHANYPAGCHEIAVEATNVNGFTATNTYAVFCTLLVDSQNPAGFAGSFTLDPIIANVKEIADSSTGATDLQLFLENGIGSDNGVLLSKQTGMFLHNEIIDSVTDTTNYVITTGSDATDNNAYLGALAIFIDNADPNQVSFRLVTNYVASTRTVTVNAAPDFAVTNVDRMVILPQATATTVWDRVLTGSTHNIPTSAGRRLRGIQEFQGYEDGAVWIDTTANGSAGTTNFENGTVENPVDNINDANTLATSLGLSRFRIAPNSSITLAASQENQVFIGDRWTLDLNGKSVSGSMFSGADVNGIGTGAAEIRFEHCHFINVTLPPSDMERCILEGTFTFGTAGDFFFEDCKSGVAGLSTPTLDFGSALNASNINFRNYSGGIEIQNMGKGTGDYNMSLEGDGQLVINANNTADGGGTSIVAIRGHFTVTDNASGAVTLSEDARIDVAQIKSEIVDALNVDTYAEPGQEAPGATVTLVDKIGYLYKTLRNKKDQTSSMFQLYNDGGTTVDQKSTVTESDGTVTKGELATGP